MIKKIAYILMPISRDEIGKCLSMGLMFLFILFNYDLLRPLKDSLIVPTIGPEVVGFVKMYTITPVALSFMIIYTYLSERLPFEKIFYYISSVFLIFFLMFGFVFYPYQDFFHPSASSIDALIHSEISLFSWKINMMRFKWFLKMYGKWSFVLFYVFAELWGSAMIFMLFWQFANKVTTTDEAKRLYPIYSLVGHFGLLGAGILVGYFSTLGEYFIKACMLTASFCTVAAIGLFIYNKRVFAGHMVRIAPIPKKAEEYKRKLTVRDSFKIILSSKYLGLIITLVFAYGTCINLIEGVWRNKAVQFYQDTVAYSRFMSQVIKFNGIVSIAGLLISGPLLRLFGWLFGALVLPILMLITGVVFFLLAIFDTSLSTMVGFNVLFITVVVGSIQNIVSRSAKYAFFDITKEMAYIPCDEHLRSKGKAAVDIVGARWAKSIGALLQSSLFIIFPMATYDTLAPYLMVLYIVIAIVWLLAVKNLYKAYSDKLKAVKQHNIT